jgi:hypothetical protein
MLERVAAAVGQMESAPPQFAAAQDIPRGGLLLAVPALLAMGLLRHSLEMYALPRGFYGLSSILLLLAMMALGRVKSIEQLRYVTPGEFGNLLGLDRVPEVRTLREKLQLLCAQKGRAAQWNAELAKQWMGLDPEAEPMFYVDGHVRVYRGELAHLPRHYVARQKLYLRATVDYWINALDGQPFFYVNQEIDHGLVQALGNDIVPWLETHAPIRPEHQQRMDHDALTPRFTIVFDREGYSPDLFEALQKRRIAVLSYHRYPGDDWEAREFQSQVVTLANGETVPMKLAERGTRLPKGLWIREVRKLTASGEQISLVSTHGRLEAGALAAALFARWSQENFFRYMRQNYAIDRLVEFGAEYISDTEVAVNPAWGAQPRGPKTARSAQESACSVCRRQSNGARFRRCHYAVCLGTRPAAGDHRRTPTTTGGGEEETKGDSPSHSRQRLAGGSALQQIAARKKTLYRHHQDDQLSRRDQHGGDPPRKDVTRRRRARFATANL